MDAVPKKQVKCILLLKTETKVAILEEKLNSSDQLLAKIESAIDKLIEANSNVHECLPFTMKS
jgi:hypothetical protein